MREERRVKERLGKAAVKVMENDEKDKRAVGHNSVNRSFNEIGRVENLVQGELKR